MPATLQETLLAPQTQPQVVADGLALIEQEVSAMSGVSGTAVKVAYKTARKLAPDYIQYLVQTLLPKMAEQLEPYWADFHAAGASDFGDYLSKRGDEVAGSLLSITDARAAGSSRPTLIKAYSAVRGHAARHVIAALPQVGALVQQYA